VRIQTLAAAKAVVEHLGVGWGSTRVLTREMEMADGVKFKGEYMGSQYSLYVLPKGCDRRNSYLIANYYYYDKRGEESKGTNHYAGEGGRAETTAKRNARTGSK
jgi:hypothetical protein